MRRTHADRSCTPFSRRTADKNHRASHVPPTRSAGDQRAKWMRSAARQRSYYCPSRRTLEDAGTRGRHSAEKMTPSGTPIYRKCSYIEEMKNEHKNVTQNKQNGRIWSEGIASSGSTRQWSLTAFSSGETPTRQCCGIPAKSRSQTSPLLWSDDPRREKLRCSCVSVHISASAFAMSMSARIQKVGSRYGLADLGKQAGRRIA